MTEEKAAKIFKQTGNLQDYIINCLDAYSEQLANNPKLADTKYKLMNHAIAGSKMIVRECYRISESVK